MQAQVRCIIGGDGKSKMACSDEEEGRRGGLLAQPDQQRTHVLD